MFADAGLRVSGGHVRDGRETRIINVFAVIQENIMPDNKALHRFFDALNRRDPEQIGSLLAEEADLYFPKTKTMRGKDQILRFFKILFHLYPELLFQLEKTIIEGKTAAAHWKNRGKNRKGEPYNNEGITLFREGDKGPIVFMSDFFKDTEKF